VQQSIKDIHSEAGCDYNHLNKFTPYYTESTLDRLTAHPLGVPLLHYAVCTEGKGTKKPIPRRTPCATVTTPDEDFTSYITDTLLEREQIPGHTAR